MSDPAYERFEASLQGRSEPDLLVPIAGALPPSTRSRARAALMDMLTAGTGDARIPEALAIVAPDHFETLDALEIAVSRGKPAVRLGACRALFRLTGVLDLRALRALAEDAPASVRQDAVRTLGRHPSGRELALERMAKDPDPRVRSTALDGVLRAHGLEAWETRAPGVLSTVGIRIASRLAAVRQDGVDQLHGVLRGLDRGQTLIGLGVRTPPLRPEADALRRALLDPTVPLDEAAVRKLRGESARWLTDLALGLLDRGDARIPGVLIVLSAERARPALVEALLCDGDAAFVTAVEDALAALG